MWAIRLMYGGGMSGMMVVFEKVRFLNKTIVFSRRNYIDNFLGYRLLGEYRLFGYEGNTGN